MITSAKDNPRELVERGILDGLISPPTADPKRRGLLIMDRRRENSMRTIAELSGVSVMTVSRALRDQSNVSDDTKAKIKSIAEEIGYKAECEVCGSKDYTISVRVADEPRKLFCGKPCLVKFYVE